MRNFNALPRTVVSRCIRGGAAMPNGGPAMLKLFSILKLAATQHGDQAETSAAWSRDPLQHPDLARMAERELADLPFPGWPSPRTIASKACDCA
ncbi:hypothetical protein [Sinorhizobium fredii]|nr:hypothetical protein [Sinorhizobium fredii]